MKKIAGLAPALITPFDEHDRVDEGALKRHIAFLFDQGAAGIAVCGSSGEYDALRME